MDRSKDELSRFERDALEKILAGDHPVLGALRLQADHCRVKARHFTGVGFSTELIVSPTVPRAELPVSRADITDVIVEADTLQHGAGLVLFIESGALQALECATYAEPWPESLGPYRLRYVDAEHRDFETLSGPRRGPFPKPQLD